MVGRMVLSVILIVVGLGIALVLLTPPDWRFWRCPVREGQAALEAGDLAKAISEFSRATRRCESDVAARFMLGLSSQLYGWEDEALEAYQRTWDLAVSHATRAMHNAGTIHLRQGRPEEAAHCFQRALRLDPEAGNVRAALRACQEQLNPRSSDTPPEP